MALFNSTPILTNKIFLNDEQTAFLELNNNNLKFDNGIEYKLNFDNINESNDKVNILKKLDIKSDNSQLSLSTNSSNYFEFTVNNNNELKIDGKNSLNTINISNSRITNISDPIDSKDAVNKEYIDNILSNIPLDILNQITQTHINILIDLSKLYNFNRNSLNVSKVQEQLTIRNKFQIQLPSFMFALSSEYCPIEINNSVITFKIPQEIFLTEVIATVTKHPVGCKGIKLNIRNVETNCNLLIDDLHILSNSKCASFKYINNVSNFAENIIKKDTELTVDINDVGNVFTGTGLKLTLIGI